MPRLILMLVSLDPTARARRARLSVSWSPLRRALLRVDRERAALCQEAGMLVTPRGRHESVRRGGPAQNHRQRDIAILKYEDAGSDGRHRRTTGVPWSPTDDIIR